MREAMTAEEKKWQGRDDAYTLSRAEAIKQDKERMANAQKEAKNMLAERDAELNGLRKVAGRRVHQHTDNPQKNTQNGGIPTTVRDNSGVAFGGRDPFAFPGGIKM